MIELFQHANWEELYYFFARGEPPLAVILLILNTIFFILWILRRMRGARAMSSETAITVQALLIGSNLALMFRNDFLSAISFGYYWHKLITGLPSF